jgi:hypothetical protein
VLNSRSLLGIVLLVLGLVFLLDRTGAVDAGTVIADWWPALVVLAGALAFADRPPRPIAATVLVIVGLVLLAITTGFVDPDVMRILGPLALVGLGAWLITGRRVGRSAVDSGDAVNVTVLFSGNELVNTSPDFTGGSLTAVFGGIDLDLLRATPTPDAQLDATALFGGVELMVPDDWRVIVDGPAIFGGFTNRADPVDPRATLRVRALVMFGGIDIKTAPRPADTLPGDAAVT